jgi:hypothetical protein
LDIFVAGKLSDQTTTTTQTMATLQKKWIKQFVFLPAGQKVKYFLATFIYLIERSNILKACPRPFDFARSDQTFCLIGENVCFCGLK